MSFSLTPPMLAHNRMSFTKDKIAATPCRSPIIHFIFFSRHYRCKIENTIRAKSVGDMEKRRRNVDTHVEKGERERERDMRPHPKQCTDATHQTQTDSNQFTAELHFFCAVSVSDRKSHWCRKRMRQNQTLPVAAVEIFPRFFRPTFCNFIFGCCCLACPCPTGVFQFRYMYFLWMNPT